MGLSECMGLFWLFVAALRFCCFRRFFQSGCGVQGLLGSGGICSYHNVTNSTNIKSSNTPCQQSASYAVIVHNIKATVSHSLTLDRRPKYTPYPFISAVLLI